MTLFDAAVWRELWVWTPFLLTGFGLNILIALLAMLVGTSLGWGLALLRLSERKAWVKLSLLLTEFTRNVPTIVFQFYLAFMLPSEFVLPGTTLLLGFPGWLNASLALAIAVIGFTSDNLTNALKSWRMGDHSAALLFLPNWTSYMLIIVIASSTASIIGVSELVSRCNTVINATGNTRLMLPVYLYACLCFFLFCYPLTMLMQRYRSYLAARFTHKTS
ncbi:polar amino acid ABC transporter permease [Rhodoferax sp.]|uniref:polar amino acid ABC transporter permease n=1 Tax=Rhodoferax sp. TaxID=50421 RepID=UPI0026209D20|nr:polar amino acid ABC transporter permease [Rhodoferax sp.]MDD2811288.1 polar amino acid ABC transporter permease [Rhodoferax sp.]MDD5478852.1 polar amino acid ABC transporter permease [Rhodoferax sp.]